jgi:hypothetical protein
MTNDTADLIGAIIGLLILGLWTITVIVTPSLLFFAPIKYLLGG